MAKAILRDKLKLMATPGAWRLHSARKADPRFVEFEKRVFNRDSYTCQFCGFQATAFQEIVNLDCNYRNNKISNMVTACCFCAQCYFLESVGVGGYGGGTLIYLPELTQAELNSFCHVLFCAITNDTGYKEVAQNIYRNLKSRSKALEDKYGEGSSDPSFFGHLIIDSQDLIKTIDFDIYAGIRLLPSRAKFRKQIEHWAVSALEVSSLEQG